jgi:amino acid transporter
VLSLRQATFTSIANQGPGTSVAVNFAFAALFAGSGLPLTMVLALIATLFLANTLGQFSRHLSSAAGFGQYVSRGLGPKAGFFTAWSALLYGILFPATNSVLVSSFVSDQVAAATGWRIPWELICIVLIGTMWFIAFRGIAGSAKTALILGALEIAVFVGLAIVLIAKAGHHNSVTPFTHSPGPFGLAWGMIFGFLSFSGFEGVASLAEETKDPRRYVGRAAFMSVGITGAFFILLAYAGEVGWGIGKMNGHGSGLFSSDPFAYGTLASTIWGPAHWIILLIVLNSNFAAGLAGMNFAARYMYSLGRVGVLPKRLAEIHPVNKTPATAIHIMGVLSVVLGVGLGMWWHPVLAYSFLATLFTFAWILTFSIANIALPFFYRKEHRSEFRVFKHVVLPVVATLALIPALVSPLLPYLPQFKAAGPVAVQVVATVPLVAAWSAVGVVWARRMRREKAAAVASLGQDYDRPPGLTESASGRLSEA